MRPPACLAVLMLAACDFLLPPIDDTGVPQPGPAPDAGCLDEGWVADTDAEVFITQLIVDAVGLTAGVDPTATYDGVPAVCVDPAGGGVELVFEVGDAPFGRVRMVTSNTGSLDLVGDGTLEVELFGADSPVTFGSAHWVFGGWDVTSLNPLETVLTDVQGQRDGRFLTLSLTASVAP